MRETANISIWPEQGKPVCVCVEGGGCCRVVLDVSTGKLMERAEEF